MTLLHRNLFDPWRNFDRMLGAAGNGRSWAPAFDTAVTDAAYTLTGDVPGVSQKDIAIRVADGVLTVRAERAAPEESEGVRWQRLERPLGEFVRRFRLPEDVNEAEVKATYENGVLELTLPRQEPVDKARLVPVT